MRRVVLLVVALSMVAGACTHASGRGTLRLGALYPLGGAQGPGGTEEYRGVQLAVERANAGGGVKGKRVALDSMDVESAEAAPAAVRRLATRGAVVLGSYGSTISAPASSTAASRGLVFWETGAVGETASGAGAGRNFFRAPPTGVSLGQAGVAFMRDVLVPKLMPGARCATRSCTSTMRTVAPSASVPQRSCAPAGRSWPTRFPTPHAAPTTQRWRRRWQPTIPTCCSRRLPRRRCRLAEGVGRRPRAAEGSHRNQLELLHAGVRRCAGRRRRRAVRVGQARRRRRAA